MKSSSLFMERNIEKLDHVKTVKWVDGVLLVEDRIRNLQEKVYACSHEPDLRVLKSDLEKRTATSESALKRARLNYSIAKEDGSTIDGLVILTCSRDGDDDESTDGGSDDGSDTQLPTDCNISKLLKSQFNRATHSEGYLIYQGSSEVKFHPSSTSKITYINNQYFFQQVIPRKYDDDIHHVHHYHDIDIDEPLSNQNDFGLNDLSADAPHCGLINIGSGLLKVPPAAEKVFLTYTCISMPNTEQPFRLKCVTFSMGGEQSNNGSGISIFLGDLATDVINTLLHEPFANKYPSVKDAKLVIDSNIGCSKGYGFVRFGDDDERTVDMTEMNGTYC
ncbi:polyadenylate-binding protein RBP47-like protein [Tanacetum coccineum]